MDRQPQEGVHSGAEQAPRFSEGSAHPGGIWRSASARANNNRDSPSFTVATADVPPRASLHRDWILEDLDERPFWECRDRRCRCRRTSAQVRPGPIGRADDVGRRRRWRRRLWARLAAIGGLLAEHRERWWGALGGTR